jgi:hypothetical protein
MEVVAPGRTGSTYRGRGALSAGWADVSDWPLGRDFVTAAFALMMIYRLMALFVAAMMIYVLWRERDWRPQFYAALVFVPFILRGLGIK